MTERKQIWKCSVCGNIIEVLHEGGGTLVCCGKKMDLMVENSVDAAEEKHIPVIEGRKVRVGSVAHPMEEGHYIEWIEVFPKKGRSLKIFLKPGDLSEIEVCFDPIDVRAYCNLHGLWKS